MLLYKANGEPWNPFYEETHVLDDLMRRIIDALRYRRPGLESTDDYSQALARLSEAATEYTAALRRDREAAGRVPEVRRWAS